jgi:hypothetical protein
MKTRGALTIAVVVGALGFFAGRSWSGDDTAPKMPSPEEMQKMMAEMAALAPEHKALAADAGTWDADVTMWMDPSKPPTTSKGTSVRTVVNQGHYVTDSFSSEMMGRPFQGFGVQGYSKERKQWFGFWCDSMGSAPEIMWGTADAAGKVITFDGPEMTCMMGKFIPRWVVKHDDADHMSFEHWSKYPTMGDQYNKEIEVKYTRRK